MTQTKSNSKEKKEISMLLKRLDQLEEATNELLADVHILKDGLSRFTFLEQDRLEVLELLDTTRSLIAEGEEIFK